MYFADLTVYSYLHGKEIPNIYNVGWLDIEHPFPKGEVPSLFLEKLKYLYLNGFSVFRTRGQHSCSFCSEDIKLESDNRRLSLGSSEIWIPNKDGIIYAAPNMIYHYIKAHHYKPPQEFLDALLDPVFPDNWGDDWIFEEILGIKD